MSGMEQRAGQALNNQGEQCDLESATTFEVLSALVDAVVAHVRCATQAPAHPIVSVMGNIVRHGFSVSALSDRSIEMLL